MAMQSRADHVIEPFLLDGPVKFLDTQTLLQDAGRATDMVVYTLMSQVPTTGKWVPFTDETAVDGTEKPQGILVSPAATAALVAGDVTDVQIYKKCTFNREQLVIENSKTLATVIGTLNMTVEAWLISIGLIPESTIQISSLENV
jgi:hypothetical protein